MSPLSQRAVSSVLRRSTKSIAAGIVAIVVLILAPTSFGQSAAKPKLPILELTDDEVAVCSTMRRVASCEAVEIAQHARSRPLVELGCDDGYTNGMVVHGYVISEVHIGGTTQAFEIKAEPLNRETGRYSFAITEDYALRYLEGPVAPGRCEGSEFDQVTPKDRERGAQLAHAAERAQREFVLSP